MAQSLLRLWTHLIFSTKERFPFLKDEQIRNDMHAYLATVLHSHDCETLIVGGAQDHVHCLFDLSRKHSISHVVKEIKRTSSVWIKDVSRQLRKFHWQNGTQGVALGWNWLTPPAFSSARFVTQGVALGWNWLTPSAFDSDLLLSVGGTGFGATTKPPILFTRVKSRGRLHLRFLPIQPEAITAVRQTK